MRIDGWDIANADAVQWNVTFGFHEMKNDSEWVRGGLVPVMVRNNVGFKTMTVRILIKCRGGRQEILRRCSRILAHLAGPAELDLDGVDHRFHAILSGEKHEEKVMERWHALALEFDCYEYSSEVIRSSAGRRSFTVDNPGSMDTPVKVGITVGSALPSVTLTGLCRDPVSGEPLDIVVRNLTPGKAVTIDGETGLVTQDGEQKAGDAEFWDMPALRPGENRIGISGNAELTLTFRPRYM